VTTISTIAIIDDDAGVRSAIEDLLRSDGCQTVVFGEAVDFIQSLGISDCNCIVSNLQMPNTSGLDLISTLHFRSIHIPVIIIAALMATAVQVRIGKAGAFDLSRNPLSRKPC
jgi:two-component system response regulator FixJ